MKTYRELSTNSLQNLSFIQTGDRFTRDGHTYEVGERIEDDTYHLTSLSTGNTGKCFLNQVIDRAKRGDYDSFKRVVVKEIYDNDILFDIYRGKYYTVLSFELSDYKEVMAIIKDHDNYKQIKWTKNYVLDQIHRDKFRLISNITNNNEKTTVTNTDIIREGGARIISSSTTRLITISSRLVGNAKAGTIKTTRTCSFKISKNSIPI